MNGIVNASSTAQVDTGIVAMYIYAVAIALFIFVVMRLFSLYKW